MSAQAIGAESSRPQAATLAFDPVEVPAGPAAPARLWPTALATATLCCLITFYAKGGLNLGTMSATEMALTIGSSVLAAACVLLAPDGARWHGLWPLGLLLALTALTAISIAWSVQPDESWQDAGRMLAYTSLFGAAITLARAAPRQWPAILGGIALASAIVCAYALATKVFPASLDASDTYARLQQPYGYWNAVGLTAAMGSVCLLWLGARRAGHGLLTALAYPGMGLTLLTLVLAYSRGSLVALAVGGAVWFCITPLRLRGAAVLLAGGVCAAAVGAWDFTRPALSDEKVALGSRVTAGHQLGVLIAAMLLLLTAAGVAVSFQAARRPPSAATRRRAGIAILAAIALAVLAFAGALAHSSRGLTGSISHAVSALTDPNAKTPPNTPGRLTAVASVRARYWKEALQVFSAHPALGVGADGYRTARLRYRTETLDVHHAHGFIVQTLADLGIVGLLIVLGLLASWMTAASRPARPLDGLLRRRGAERGRRPYTPERIGMLTMLCIVVVFGAHSLIDWTWYVPGDACVALICAGWLAGRGPLSAPVRARGRSAPGRVRIAAAGAIVTASLLAAWSQWQPQRAEEARAQAASLLARSPAAAEAEARRATTLDPLSVEALFALAAVQQARGESAPARATLVDAVRLQPSNPRTWLMLGRFDLAADPQAALQELQASIFLNPESIAPAALQYDQDESVSIYDAYVQALRATAALRSASASPKPAASAAHRARRRQR